MNILHIAARLPFPLDKGDKVRDYNHLKHLARKHRVTLVCFLESKDQADNVKELERIGIEVYPVGLPRYVSVFKALFAVVSRKPFQVWYYHSRRMGRLVRRLCRSRSFDLVLAHLIRMVPYAMPVEGCAKVVDLADALSLSIMRRADGAPWYQRAPLRWEEVKVRRYERLAIGSFERSLVVSHVDKDYLSDEERVHVVPMGVNSNISAVERPGRNRDRLTLIFTGNMGYYPNVDAACRLVLDIVPLVRRKHPHAKVRIVGADPVSRVRALHGGNVEVTGRVPDIWRELVQADILVAPVRFGAGVQNKILEAMAAGVPVVTTSRGSEGLGGVHGSTLLVANSPDEYARMIDRLHNDSDLYNSIASAARKYVRARFDWESVVQRLEQVYEEAVEQYRRKTSSSG